MLNEHGVQIAPSTYYVYASRCFGPTEAEYDDAYAANDLHRMWVKNGRLYGRREHWKTDRRVDEDWGRDQVIEMTLRPEGLTGREVLGLRSLT